MQPGNPNRAAAASGGEEKSSLELEGPGMGHQSSTKQNLEWILGSKVGGALELCTGSHRNSTPGSGSQRSTIWAHHPQGLAVGTWEGPNMLFRII